MSPVLHKEYYMKDGVSFQVEDVLFRVPRYMLENSSPVLSKMLETAGQADSPIFLSEIKSDEFEDLLAFLYPLAPQLISDMSNPPSHRDEQRQWISIMHLATIWDMQTIRLAAMQILSHSVQDPMTKIALGKQYDYIPWLKEGFTVLCVRPEPLSVVEASQLTTKDIVACAAARESIRGVRGVTLPTRGRLSAYPEYEALLNNTFIQGIVENTFRFSTEETTESLGDGSIAAESAGPSSRDSPVSVETSNEALRLQFIPNLELSILPQKFQNWGRDVWEARLVLRPKVSYNPFAQPAIREYLAGISCLLVLTVGILVVTW